MRRVEEITRETNEVAAILSPLMDEPSQSPVALPNPPSLTSPEIPKLVPSPPIPPHPTRFIGLDPAFHAILEQLLTRDRWSPADFHALAREFHFMPLRVRDTLNGWSDDAYGDFILDGDDPIIVRRELITKEANLYG
jgi:hypothetical protein